MQLVLISKEAEVDTAPMALKGEDEGRDGGGGLWCKSGELQLDAIFSEACAPFLQAQGTFLSRLQLLATSKQHRKQQAFF